MKFNTTRTTLAAAFIAANLVFAGPALAHCDGLDGPVIIEARAALEKKDVTPLLKWVPEKGEPAIKAAFAKALTERAAGANAREAADHKLFEKLVRVHRESEGAPYSGIKPAGQIAPVVAEADAALARKDVDQLAKHVAAKVEQAVREKFELAAHSQAQADASVAKGREFVANYVQYVHFVEEVNNLAGKKDAHHEPATKGAHHEPAKKAAAHKH
ncbi:MAG: DUF6448 family protein [Betaproteobacteria bacterium]